MRNEEQKSAAFIKDTKGRGNRAEGPSTYQSIVLVGLPQKGANLPTTPPSFSISPLSALEGG